MEDRIDWRLHHFVADLIIEEAKISAKKKWL